MAPSLCRQCLRCEKHGDRINDEFAAEKEKERTAHGKDDLLKALAEKFLILEGQGRQKRVPREITFGSVMIIHQPLDL